MKENHIIYENNLKKWKFGIDNNELISLVLANKKRATTSLYTDDNDLPIIGEESIICYDDDSCACIVKTKDYKIMRFKDMTEDFAKLEGPKGSSAPITDAIGPDCWTHYNFIIKLFF